MSGPQSKFPFHPAEPDSDAAVEKRNLHEAVAYLRGTNGGRLSGLRGPARTYAVSRLHVAGEATVFIVRRPQDVAPVAGDLAYFLSEAGVADPVLRYPAWQTLPFDDVSPHPDTVGERLRTLAHLADGLPGIVVTSFDAVYQATLSAERLATFTLRLKTGDERPPGDLVRALVNAGYQSAVQVEDPGEFALRGGILDVFPLGAEGPYRFDFFGDEIEGIRRFDASTQVSLKTVEKDTVVLIPPAREWFFLPDEEKRVAAALREIAADVALQRSSLDALLESLHTRQSFPFQDYLLPAALPGSALWDYLPPEAKIWTSERDEALDLIDDLHQEAEARYRRLLDQEKLVLAPHRMYADREGIIKKVAAFHHGRFESLRLMGDQAHLEGLTNEDITAEVKQKGGLTPLAERIRKWRDAGLKVKLTARTRGGAERLYELLEPYGVVSKSGDTGALVLHAPLSRGFRIARERIAIVTEEDIFGVRRRHAPARTVKKETFVAQLRELKAGDFIVHVKHGVGKYLGLETRTVAGETGDFFRVEYQGGDALYIPVYKLEGVQKYVGSEGSSPRLDKLGGQAWEKTKRKVKDAVLAMAADLLDLYAAREVVVGHAFQPPGHLYQEFEQSFEFEETPDQAQAIEEALQDMQRPRPMDRLICGDVGYGKTEVAMRAAFKAVEDGKQVAILVPTTILAFQHLQTFRERFEPFPAKVEMLSRFVSPAEQKEILARTKKGEVDVVIGTHKLLQGDVNFKDLGLLVIDEEHRFGVKHKEKIKQLKKSVDVMTMTATPIPRTLHLSILGLRDLSIIATPPRDRLAIRTFVTPFDESALQEAIRRELRRQGQIFFIHNRIDSIHAMADQVRRIVPEVRLEVAHGQMHEADLEKIMLRFLNHEFDLLLCTTIVESGIDIPTANTMIINRADRFGLAELYQLRGRVGRSSQRAYAYLVIDSEAGLTPEARQRLDVIQSFAELGSGFHIAAHDLEIRGAGEILGKNQSGQIAAVGFDLYSTLLEQAVGEIRGESFVERVEPDLNLHFSAFIPEKFMPDVSQRLDFYQRLSRLQLDDDAEHIRAEMEDRYGEIPSETENLIEVSKLKITLRALGVRTVDLSKDKAIVRFDPSTPLDPAKLVTFVAKEPERLRFVGGDKLAFSLYSSLPTGAVREFLGTLQEVAGFARI